MLLWKARRVAALLRLPLAVLRQVAATPLTGVSKFHSQGETGGVTASINGATPTPVSSPFPVPNLPPGKVTVKLQETMVTDCFTSGSTTITSVPARNREHYWTT